MTTRLVAVPVVLLALLLSACNGGSSEEGQRATGILTSAILYAVADQPPQDPDDPEALPIVYVVAVGEQAIGATVQAEVATALTEEVVVRFADARDEAIDTGAEGAPVIDGGLLLLVSKVPEEGDPVDVAIEIYRDESEWNKAIFSFTSTGEAWSVTSTSHVPLDAP